MKKRWRKLTRGNVVLGPVLLICLGKLCAAGTWSELSATREMCVQETRNFCPGAGHNISLIADCLHDHFAEFSRGCLDYSEYNHHSRGALPTECIADARRLSGPLWLSRSALESKLKTGARASDRCQESLASHSLDDVRVVISPPYSYLSNALDTLATLDELVPDPGNRKGYHDVMLALTVDYARDRDETIRQATAAMQAAGDSIWASGSDAADEKLRSAWRAVLHAVEVLIRKRDWPSLSESEKGRLVERSDALFGHPAQARRSSVSGSVAELKKWLLRDVL